MSKDLWLMEYERACDNFADTDDEEAFRAEMKRLGHDPDEIEEHIHEIRG